MRSNINVLVRLLFVNVKGLSVSSKIKGNLSSLTGEITMVYCSFFSEWLDFAEEVGLKYNYDYKYHEFA